MTMMSGMDPMTPMTIGKVRLNPVITLRAMMSGTVTHMKNGTPTGALAVLKIPTASLPTRSGKIGKMKASRFISLPNVLLPMLIKWIWMSPPLRMMLPLLWIPCLLEKAKVEKAQVAEKAKEKVLVGVVPHAKVKVKVKVKEKDLVTVKEKAKVLEGRILSVMMEPHELEKVQVALDLRHVDMILTRAERVLVL